MITLKNKIMGSIQIDIWKKIDEKLYMLKRKKKMVQENKLKKKKLQTLALSTCP